MLPVHRAVPCRDERLRQAASFRRALSVLLFPKCHFVLRRWLGQRYPTPNPPSSAVGYGRGRHIFREAHGELKCLLARIVAQKPEDPISRTSLSIQRQLNTPESTRTSASSRTPL